MPHPFPNLPPARRGQVHVLRHRSDALRGNPWGDPHERDVHVYTPPGHDGRDLPALLVLAPFAGTGESLLGRSLTEVSFATRADALIDAGCPPFVAVLPDCMTSVGGSQFLDSPGIGAYATYVIDEIRGFVAERFGVSGRWGAVGRSSGGFGALTLAMDRPGALQAVGCLAGDMGFDLAYLGELAPAFSAMKAAGGPTAFLEGFWAKHRASGHDFAAFNVLAMSCAYAPDPTATPPCTLPFDPDTGEVRFEVLERWLAHDPVRRIEDPACQAALRQLDLLFVDAGERDEYHLQHGARRFVARLEALGIDHVYEEFRGGHRGTSWRYDVAVPQIVTALCP